MMAEQPIQAPDYRTRRGEMSAYGRALESARYLRIIIIVLGISLVVGLLTTALWALTASSSILIAAFGLLALLSVLGLWLVYRYMNQHFIEPDLAFRMWLQQVCDGDLDARIDLPEYHKHHKELNFHTRNLATALSRLSDDMDSLVESQTRTLKDQKQVLELLFKLTSDVASDADGDNACHAVCEYLSDWFQAESVCCFRVVGLKQPLTCVVEHSPLSDLDQRQYALSKLVIDIQEIPNAITEKSVAAHENLSEYWVPFYAGETPAGVMIVLFNHTAKNHPVETQRVLATASEQLSLLCSKQLIQQQTLSARLNRDRNELAAELHDSLAQTLLAARYQLTLLAEKLRNSATEDEYKDSVKICASIEEANAEVRGLIRENRIPLSEHRYVDSLQKAIDQFSQTNDVPVFFQTDQLGIRFTPREETTLQRIILEALNNALKHANASMLRVYITESHAGVRTVLVEDDGVGFEFDSNSQDAKELQESTGEHIGLTIMRERAMSIGANLIIDSESGEGTRVTIVLPPVPDVYGKSL